MEALTVIPSIPEGFGSLLQYALSTYIVAREQGLPYIHSEFKFEHGSQEGKDEKTWNDELNEAINLFVPCHKFRDREPHRVGVVRPEKWYLENAVRNRSPVIDELRARYRARTNIPCYFNKSKINVAIHARTFNSTDCDISSFREYVKNGSESDLFLLGMIKQLSATFPNCEFHLYVKSRELVAHYTTIPNVYIHSDTSLLSDLHHMIMADLLIMAKSSLSAIASYYRTGPSLMRESYGYAVPASVLFVNNNELSDDQINILQPFFVKAPRVSSVLQNVVIMPSCSDEKVPDKS
jgi:hypothetical protein